MMMSVDEMAALQKAQFFVSPETRAIKERAERITEDHSSVDAAAGLVVLCAILEDFELERIQAAGEELAMAQEMLGGVAEIERRLLAVLESPDGFDAIAERSYLTPAERSALRMNVFRHSRVWSRAAWELVGGDPGDRGRE